MDRYENPLIERYASPEMSALWSPQRKFETWRRLWIVLAETQRELGLDISDEQLDEMRQHVADIDFEAAETYERRLRHDVMAHVYAFGDQCPTARPIIHLGATSCYVTDNADLIIFRDSLDLLRKRVAAVIRSLAGFAERYRDVACLGLTHLQPAQPTTVGKRACLWLHDLLIDFDELDYRAQRLRARGTKGTTGTQASFLELFAGDHRAVRELDRRVAERLGFSDSYPVTGQTYSRKIDSQILDALSGIAQSAHKAATDIRILSSRKEMEEPFEKDQIGSSAMAYKRNPMRSERICSLARYVMALAPSAAQTAATQWMERTLDDSAIRRINMPQAFLAIDAILALYHNVVSGLVVYPRVIANHLAQEVPFMATENILMAAVAAGGDRQDLHERIRQHSVAAAREVKEHGRPNDLLERIRGDAAFARLDIDALADPARFVGRAPRQVDEFLSEALAPVLARCETEEGPPEIHV